MELAILLGDPNQELILPVFTSTMQQIELKFRGIVNQSYLISMGSEMEYTTEPSDV